MAHSHVPTTMHSGRGSGPVPVLCPIVFVLLLASHVLKPRLRLPHPHQILVPLVFCKAPASAFLSIFATTCSTSTRARPIRHASDIIATAAKSSFTHSLYYTESLSSGTIHPHTRAPFPSRPRSSMDIPLLSTCPYALHTRAIRFIEHWQGTGNSRDCVPG